MTITNISGGVYEEITPTIFNPTDYSIYQLDLSDARTSKQYNITTSQVMILHTNGSFTLDFNEKGIIESSDDIIGKILPIAFNQMFFTNTTQVSKIARFLVWH